MALPYRIRRGSWRPARFRRCDHIVLMVALILVALIRGLDYSFGDDIWAAKDFMLEVAPAEVWGVCGFLAGALVLTIGVIRQRHLLVYIGHGWLAIAYSLNALALFLVATPNPPFFDGIRGAGATAFVALVHIISALRTGTAPLRVDVNKPAEILIEGEAE